MDADITERRGPTPGWVPWAVAALLSGAAISLVVELLPSWYQIFGPYLIVDARLVVDALASIALFVLPAAVLLGSGRWAAGRRWLWWAAVALAVLAVISLVREAWFTALAVWPDSVSMDAPGLWTALWLGDAAAMIIGAVLLAVGLWTGGDRSASEPARPWIRAASALVALLSVAVVLASAATSFVIPWNGIEFATLAIGGGLLLAVGYGALGLVAIAALRAMPRDRALPEMLIAAGAIAEMLGSAGIWVLPYVFLGEVPAFVTGLFIAFGALTAGGALVMAAGFALGARVEARGEPVASPA